MNEKTCINCGCSLKENDYTKYPEEINFEVISINGIFGDSFICPKCFNNKMVDNDPEFAKVINENFWDIL